MALVVTIGGVTTTIDEGSLNIAATASGVDRLTCEVTSADGSVRPAMDAELIVTLDGTRIFGGILDAPEEAGFQSVGLTPITTKVTAKDFNIYAEWRLVFLTIPAGTLKAALTALLPYLSGYGVTLDPAQVDGPSLPELTYNGKTVAEVFAHLEQLTEYTFLRNISYAKVLGFYEIGLATAPFDVADGDSHVDGDVSIRPKRTGYANRVLVFAGSGQSNVTRRVHADGVTRQWVLQGPPAVPGAPFAWTTWVIEEGYTIEDAAHRFFLLTDRYTSDPNWPGYWDDATLTWELDATFTWDAGIGCPIVNGVIPTGWYFDFTYLAQWPYIAQADDAAEQAARGVRELSISAADVFDLTVADAMADAELVRRLVSAVRIAKYATYDHGLAPGQVQAIAKSDRHVSANFLITDVVARDVFTRMRYEVTAIEGSIKQASWRDVYRSWAGGEGATSGGTVSVGSGGSVSVCAPPVYYLGGSRFHAVQVPA
jgi:hypothetical protein